MFKKINLLIGALLAIGFSGCGSTSTDMNNNVSDVDNNIRMERNKSYDIEKGDKIEKISENPKIKIDSNLDTGKSSVTLLSGSAVIIKGNK